MDDDANKFDRRKVMRPNTMLMIKAMGTWMIKGERRLGWIRCKD